MSADDRVAVPARTQNIILENRKKLNISGVEEILRFDDTLIVMKTVLGELFVRGTLLHVEKLSVESGELSVTGEVTELGYAESAERGGFWSRVFG